MPDTPTSMPNARSKTKGEKPPLFVDLCCGAGGMSYGFVRAGWAPLLGVDNSKHSAETYEANLNAAVASVDLSSPNAHISIRRSCGGSKPDAVIAGPPCQGFSRAGPRRIHDSRNDLLIACARIAVALKPKLVVIENVPNLASLKYRPILEHAIRIVRGAGYAAEYCIVNARNHGVAQNRPRLILVASRDASRESISRALQAIGKKRYKQKNVSAALAGLPVRGKRFDRNGIPNHTAMQHTRQVQKKIEKIRPGEGPLSYRKLHPRRVAGTLVCGHRALPCHYKAPRTITTREAARLQGFPDTFVFHGPRGNQMLQVANAVPPPTAAVVARQVMSLLNNPGPKGSLSQRRGAPHRQEHGQPARTAPKSHASRHGRRCRRNRGNGN